MKNWTKCSSVKTISELRFDGHTQRVIFVIFYWATTFIRRQVSYIPGEDDQWRPRILPSGVCWFVCLFLAFSRTVALITALIFHVWRPSLLLKRTSAVVLLSATSTLQFWPRLIKCSRAQSTGEITIQWIRFMDTNCVIRWIVIYAVDSVIYLLNN